MLLGLTGSIATGKSTVSAMLRQKGAYIIDADQVAREAAEPGSEGLKRIVAHFGEEMLDDEGNLDRTRLGAAIFKDPLKRKTLNQLLHPLIMQTMQFHTDAIKKRIQHAMIIWDVPLLIEENLTRYVEAVILVYVPREIQLKRLMKRNSLSEKEAMNRIEAQMDIEEKKKVADYIIDNSGTLSDTERQVDQLWNYLISRSG